MSACLASPRWLDGYQHFADVVYEPGLALLIDVRCAARRAHASTARTCPCGWPRWPAAACAGVRMRHADAPAPQPLRSYPAGRRTPSAASGMWSQRRLQGRHACGRALGKCIGGVVRRVARRLLVPSAGSSSPAGWSVMPVFERAGAFVATGVYHLPLFQGVPSRNIIQVRAGRAAACPIGARPQRTAAAGALPGSRRSRTPSACLPRIEAVPGVEPCQNNTRSVCLGCFSPHCLSGAQEFANKGDVDSVVVQQLRVRRVWVGFACPPRQGVGTMAPAS